jgi:hypothetical protein
VNTEDPDEINGGYCGGENGTEERWSTIHIHGRGDNIAKVFTVLTEKFTF